MLGEHVYLGRFVELATTEDGSLTVGADTSIQDYSVMIGDIQIGAHCIFAPNVHVASHNHHFRDNPPWLIRDQDVAFAQGKTAPVIIEDDCWIGRNAVILPGVYVGRGAVIGANCVVSRDVRPYEVHAGATNAPIGRRLEFIPPHKLDPMDDACLPYLYRGFRLTQRQLEASRAKRCIAASDEACLVMAAGGKVQISGRCLDRASSLTLQFGINGVLECEQRIMEREFVIEMEVPESTRENVPAPLRQYTVVEISAKPPTARYGIDSALIVPRHWHP